MPCKKCQDRQSQLKHPGKSPEFTSDSIKNQRKAYANDIEQPHRKGELNKKWLDLHGVDKAKQEGFTPTEIKKAKYVYDSEKYYGDKT